MKHLDWKSFAIGILLTTTVMFGVAATNPPEQQRQQWNKNQKWDVALIEQGRSIGTQGYEPFSVVWGYSDDALKKPTIKIAYRRPRS